MSILVGISKAYAEGFIQGEGLVKFAVQRHQLSHPGEGHYSAVGFMVCQGVLCS